MDRRPGVLWFLASLIAVLLFFVPVVNGIMAGAFGGWFERVPHKAGGHALIAALAVFPVLWVVSLYGAVWWPFAPFSASLRAAFCSIPMFVVGVLVCTLRNTRRSAAV
jgi:hypothetical protein